MRKSINLLVVLYFIVLAECQTYNETEMLSSTTFWCPNNMMQFQLGEDKFQTCRPLPCLITSNVSVISDDNELVSFGGLKSYICPVTRNFDPSLSTEFCNFVRLSYGRHFVINQTDGSLFEFYTNSTYKLGEYFYHPDAGEAVICRDKLLPIDVTDDVITWCSMHRINLNETNGVDSNGSIYLKNINHTVRRGFYRVDKINQIVDICLNVQPKLWDCKHLYDITSDYFYLQSNLNLWTNDGIEIVYSVGEYYMTTNKTIATVCVEVGQPRRDETMYMYAIASVISAVFVFFTFIVHLFYRKLNYHAKALLCHIISLLIMYITMAIRTLVVDIKNEFWRLMVFSFQYISALSAFLWLNVLAFELWRAFSSQHGHQGVMSNDSNKKLWFVFKCLYACGIPVILCLLTIGLSYSTAAARLFQLKTESTWFTNEISLFIFFYTPIIIILIENLVFFLLTIWSIRKASQGTRIVNRNANKNLLRVFVKLFIVMGICWLAEAISSLLVNRTDESVWYFTDLINNLQGVAIFVVYVCKKSTWKVLKSRWKSYKSKRSQTTTQITTINMTRIKSANE
ncbi:hypothetical protein CHUAL_007719 [Chamberlinius hualienensis]